ncbi:MAG: PDDEXK nuclease domain-containing protein [Spirochaetia bacterium]
MAKRHKELGKSRAKISRDRPTSRKQETTDPELDTVYLRIHQILVQARSQLARTVNIEMVRAYWLIGREIVEEEQQGRSRANYGEELIDHLSEKLRSEFGRGFTPTNLRYMRLFYLAYPQLLDREIHHAPRDESDAAGSSPTPQLGREDEPVGVLNPDLSWTHYRLLTKVESEHARGFYEIEAVRNHWSSRELERQIDSLLFERLARTRDKKGLIRLARKGQEIQGPQDVFKDPVVLEFVGLPESHRLVESELEEALITNLQAFLLELGKGFAFVARQRRITLEGDHFYIDLVFYHVILKCYVLIDVKSTKLSHGDVGQMQLYVNYFDDTQRTSDDNPTLGLILCVDKNDLMVRYTLGKANRQIFASRYKLHLPSEKELATEIRRELQYVRPQKDKSDSE